MKILSAKICFWAEFGKTVKYLILENFGYTVRRMLIVFITNDSTFAHAQAHKPTWTEKVGHAWSNVTKTSHAPTCNVLNIWQLAICIDRAVLYLTKDTIGKELAFQPCSPPAKPVRSEAFSLLMINQKSAFQANQGFTGLLPLWIWYHAKKVVHDLNMRSKRVHRCSANLCRNANFSRMHMTFHDAFPTSSDKPNTEQYC